MATNAAADKEDGLLEKMILGEIGGKYQAIHAYDSIIWKIRTGFLTLLFGGWAVLAKSIVDSAAIADSAAKVPLINYHELLAAMLCLSCGLALGGWVIDRVYVRHKFRVILALDELIKSVHSCAGDFGRVSVGLLQVAGDNADKPFECKGYRESLNAGNCIFWVPLGSTLVAAAVLLLMK